MKFTIDFPIWGIRVYVSYTNNIIEEIKRIERKVKKRIKGKYKDYNNSVAITWGFDSLHEIYMVFARKEPGIISHEVVHASWEIARMKGFKYKAKNDENQAYLVEYMVDVIFKKLNKKWKK